MLQRKLEHPKNYDRGLTPGSGPAEQDLGCCFVVKQIENVTLFNR